MKIRVLFLLFFLHKKSLCFDHQKILDNLTIPEENSSINIKRNIEKALLVIDLKRGESSSFSYKMYSKNQKDACLEINITPNQSLYIEWLSKSSECPWFSSGNEILGFIDSLAKKYGASTIGLNDTSEISCKATEKNPDRSVNLAQLRTLTKGESWYESRGYKEKNPVVDDDQLRSILLNGNSISFLKKIKSFWINHKEKSTANSEVSSRQININDLKAFLPEGEGVFIINASDYLSEYQNYLNSKELSVHNSKMSDFISWLYENKGCHDYLDMIESIKKLPQLERIFPSYVKAYKIKFEEDIFLEKKIKCDESTLDITKQFEEYKGFALHILYGGQI